MKKEVKLSPFVRKVKGEKNWLFHDLLKEKIYQIEPSGDLDELIHNMEKLELLYQTNCVIPYNFKVDIEKYKGEIKIRELQLRITGKCGMNCSDCGSLCSCFKGGEDISDETLNNIYGQLKYLVIDSVIITGGNPINNIDLLKEIKEKIPSDNFTLLFKKFDDKEIENELTKIGFKIFRDTPFRKEIKKEDMNAGTFTFFFRQKFNPCWGKKLAIDTSGDIKPCLWSKEKVGNINSNKLQDLFFAGALDKFWELTKDKIETCNICEFRYACNDCRVAAIEEGGSEFSKTAFCGYNPKNGKWEK